jgi:outer membrane protein OmpA-like peptidoglycan-associated protein
MKAKINNTAEKSGNRSLFINGKNGAGFFPAQAKLEVGEPGDRYEQEADAIAEKVIQNTRSENGGFFSAQHPTFASSAVQEKPLAETVSPMLQKQVNEEEELMPKADGKVETPDTLVEEKIKSSKGNGNLLEPEVRTEMEQGFGANFGGVKIHTGNTAVQLNNNLKSRAFTTGNDIFFNEGQFQPQTQNGKHLLAHELTHTIQQVGSVANQVQRWPWSLTLEQQKALFRARNYGPITYRRPEISGSGFEASYQPGSGQLNVIVRGKVRFADTLTDSGGTLSSPNTFMNRSNFVTIMNGLPPEVKARIMPYLQWTDTEKQIHMVRFRQNLEATTALWQDTGMSFQINETGWEDITATPNINLNITEGDAVHKTRRGGFMNLFTQTDEAASDHLQIEIVKQPTADDVANIQRIITEHNASVGATVTNRMIRGVRSYLGNDRGSRSSAPEGFNNFMSLESDRMDDPNSQMFMTSVYFANNESTLSAEAIAGLDGFFSDPLILLDNADRAVDIDLYGYASAPGSTSYNRSLVESRISSVQNYIDNKIMESNINTSIYSSNNTNDSDTSAEADLATNPETHDPADFRRVDISVTRAGRGGQNVLAHEMGHVFGLGDEYAEVGSGYNRPAGSTATHDQLAKDAGVAGGAVVGNDNRMMSTGNVVGAAHYSTFADALNQLTSKRWKIVT